MYEKMCSTGKSIDYTTRVMREDEDKTGGKRALQSTYDKIYRLRLGNLEIKKAEEYITKSITMSAFNEQLLWKLSKKKQCEWNMKVRFADHTTPSINKSWH
jgi:hypothetical protein